MCCCPAVGTILPHWTTDGNTSPPTPFPPASHNIPEGSPKDNVLASVAGTPAAREAIMDAQIPQTARIDRQTTQTNVIFDGQPQFEPIPGTHLQYAVNSPNPVLLYNGRYYEVDNGVWFESAAQTAHGRSAPTRPADVDLIPPGCPVYNVKYVYIYDVDPEWVDEGYTPGYLDDYIFGPTVVYGTGFYYRPGEAPIFSRVPGPGDSICGMIPGLAGPSDLTMAGTGSTGTSTGVWASASAQDSGLAAGGARWPFVPPYAGWNFNHRGFYGTTAILPETIISTTTISIGEDKASSTGMAMNG